MMRRTFLPGMLVAVLLLGLSAWASDDTAGDARPARTVVLPKDKVHEGWFFGAGDQVIIDGTVNGDVYAAAGTIEVHGTVNGDLLAAGGQIIVTGTVTDDIRAAGGSIRIAGTVGKNSTLAGGSITIGGDATIGQGLLVAAGSVVHSGNVQRDARLAAGEVLITGTVAGDLAVQAERVSLQPESRVGGDLSVRVPARENLQLAEGTVQGTIDVAVMEERDTPSILGYRPWQFWGKILWTFSLILTGLVIFVVHRKFLLEYTATVRQRWGRSILWGMILLIVVPLVSLVLSLTLIGIPLALFLVATYLWVIYLSQLSLGLLLVGMLSRLGGRRDWGLFGAIVVALVIVQLLTFIPYVRTLVILGGLIVGVGALGLILGDWYAKMRAGGTQEG